MSQKNNEENVEMLTKQETESSVCVFTKRLTQILKILRNL